jgi:WD40 repeat protein
LSAALVVAFSMMVGCGGSNGPQFDLPPFPKAPDASARERAELKAGGEIAYVAAIRGEQELIVSRPDGSAPRVLTDATQQDAACFEWSPDGLRLAFATQDRLLHGRLYLWDRGRIRALTPKRRVTCRITWSPNGRSVTYARGAGYADLYAVNLASGRERLLSRSVSDVAWSRYGLARGDAALAWSPTGALASLHIDGSGHYPSAHLAVSGPGIPGHRDLTLSGTFDLSEPPAWSPDGRRLAYGRDGALFIVPVEGGEEHKLSDNGDLPAWSPDGKWIVFAAKLPTVLNGDVTGDPGGDLFAIRPEGTGLRRLTHYCATRYEIRWRP